MNARINVPHWFLIAILSLGSTFTSAQTANETPTTKPAATAAAEPADQASEKLGKDGQPDKRFVQMHESFLKRGKEGKIGLLFLGDSITEGWGQGQRDLRPALHSI